MTGTKTRKAKAPTLPLHVRLSALEQPLSLQQRNARDAERRTASDELRTLKPGPDSLEGLLLTSDCPEPQRLHLTRRTDDAGVPEYAKDFLLYLDGHAQWAHLTARQKALLELWLMHPQAYVALQAEQQGTKQHAIGELLHRNQSQVSRYLKHAHQHVDARTAYWESG